MDDPYHLLAHACIQAPSGSPRTCSRIWPDLALSNLTSGWMPSALVTMCWLDRSIDSERLHSAYLIREAIRAHQRLIRGSSEEFEEALRTLRSQAGRSTGVAREVRLVRRLRSRCHTMGSHA